MEDEAALSIVCLSAVGRPRVRDRDRPRDFPDGNPAGVAWRRMASDGMAVAADRVNE